MALDFHVQRGDLAAIAGWAGAAIPCKVLSVRMMRHAFSDASFPVAIVRVTADRPGYSRGEVCERSELLTRDNRWASLTPDVVSQCRQCSARWHGGTRADGGIAHMSNHCAGARVLTVADGLALSGYVTRARTAGRAIFDNDACPVYSAG